MRLVRYNPFNTIFNDSFFNRSLLNQEPDNAWYPPVDIMNEKENVILNVELPGIDKENISVKIEDRVLTITGERTDKKDEKTDHYIQKERSYGCFKRSFSLSDDVLVDDVDAEFKNGVLKLTLKKNTAIEKARQITIN